MAAKTITLKGDPLRKEGVTDEAITPGMLIELGGTYDVQKHSVADGPAARSWALENDLAGEGIDDDYASGETVQIGYFDTGDEVYAWLATSQTIAVGDYLVSAGAGLLAEFDPTVDTSATDAEVYRGNVVARAIEAVTTTSAAARLMVEVL